MVVTQHTVVFRQFELGLELGGGLDADIEEAGELLRAPAIAALNDVKNDRFRRPDHLRLKRSIAGPWE